jgi:hypothetical protein
MTARDLAATVREALDRLWQIESDTTMTVRLYSPPARDALAALEQLAADAMSKESAKALIEEANRWEKVAGRERARAVRAEEAITRYEEAWAKEKDGRVRAEEALRRIAAGLGHEDPRMIAREALASDGADKQPYDTGEGKTDVEFYGR